MTINNNFWDSLIQEHPVFPLEIDNLDPEQKVFASYPRPAVDLLSLNESEKDPISEYTSLNTKPRSLPTWHPATPDQVSASSARTHQFKWKDLSTGKEILSTIKQVYVPQSKHSALGQKDGCLSITKGFTYQLYFLNQDVEITSLKIDQYMLDIRNYTFTIPYQLKGLGYNKRIGFLIETPTTILASEDFFLTSKTLEATALYAEKHRKRQRDQISNNQDSTPHKRQKRILEIKEQLLSPISEPADNSYRPNLRARSSVHDLPSSLFNVSESLMWTNTETQEEFKSSIQQVVKRISHKHPALIRINDKLRITKGSYYKIIFKNGKKLDSIGLCQHQLETNDNIFFIPSSIKSTGKREDSAFSIRINDTTLVSECFHLYCKPYTGLARLKQKSQQKPQ
jgi:hypothetical protein